MVPAKLNQGIVSNQKTQQEELNSPKRIIFAPSLVTAETNKNPNLAQKIEAKFQRIKEQKAIKNELPSRNEQVEKKLKPKIEKTSPVQKRTTTTMPKQPTKFNQQIVESEYLPEYFLLNMLFGITVDLKSVV